MIRLFCDDLDGCLAFPFNQPNLGMLFHKISALTELLKPMKTIQHSYLYKARPQTFHRVRIAIIGNFINHVIFESGGGMYNIGYPNELRFNKAIPAGFLAKVSRNEKHGIEKYYPKLSKRLFRVHKKTDCGVVHHLLAKIPENATKVKAQKKALNME